MDVGKFLSKPVNPISLGLFRILFGALLLVQLSRLQSYVVETLPNSLFFLKYPGLEWVSMISPESMQLVFIAGYILILLFTLGLYSRIMAGLLLPIWGYIFFVDAGHYNNHYYLVLLLLILFTLTNADAALTLRKKAIKPTIPNWQPFIFQFQIVVVYFFGGIAKLNADWLNALPMKIWLDLSSYEFLKAEWIAYFICWYGLVFDLIIGFLLWNKKTRLLGIALLIPFHISNHFIWHIGIFPWLMIAATVLFLEPERIQKLFQRNKVAKAKTSDSPHPFPSWIKVFLVIYISFQLLFPLRQWFFDGPSYWTGYAFRFSWNMMLYDNLEVFDVKVCIPGQGTVGYIDINRYVNNKQRKKINQHPGNLVRLCHFLGEEMKEKGGIANPELNVITYRSINGRPYQLYTDTTVNIATASYSSFKVPDWVQKFEATLPN